MTYTVDELVQARADALKAGDQAAADEIAQMVRVKRRQNARARGGERSPVESATRGAVQSASFNLADEAGAALLAPIAALQTGNSLSHAYEGIRDNARAYDDVAEADNENSYLAGEFAGALVPGAAMFKGAKVAPQLIDDAVEGVAKRVTGNPYSERVAAEFLKPTGSMALAGAGGGGIAAFGASENEGTDLAIDTMTGATLGAVLAPALGSVGGTVGEWMLGAGNQLLRKFASSPNSTADRMLRESLEADGFTTSTEVIDEMNRRGRDSTMLADLGENVRQDAVVAAKQPGPGRTTAKHELDARQAGQQDRIRDGIVEGVNPKWTNYWDFRKSLSDEKRTQASAAYKAAYEKDFQPTEKLVRMQENQFVADAIRKAQDEIKRGTFTMSKEMGLNTRNNHLDIADLAKQNMDDEINALYRDGKNAEARRLASIRNQWREELDKVVPEYKTARGIYAGARQMEEAAEFGREVLGDTKLMQGDIAEMMQGWGSGQMDAYRVGIVQGMIDRMQRAGWTHDAGKRVSNSTRSDEIIDAAYPDGQAGLLRELIDNESDKMWTRNKSLYGSPTAENLSAMDRIANERQVGGFTGYAQEVLRRMVMENINPNNIEAQDLEKVAEKAFGKISDDEIRAIYRSTFRGRSGEGLGYSEILTPGLTNPATLMISDDELQQAITGGRQ